MPNSTPPADLEQGARKAVARILCKQSGHDPDGGPKYGFGYINFLENAEEVIATFRDAARGAFAQPPASVVDREATEGAWTTGALIAELKRIDPTGEMKVGLHSTGGEVDLVSTVERDEVWVALEDGSVAMATRGRFRNANETLARICNVRRSDAVFFE